MYTCGSTRSPCQTTKDLLFFKECIHVVQVGHYATPQKNYYYFMKNMILYIFL